MQARPEARRGSISAGGGKVSARESITNGLTNAVSNAIYGTEPLKGIGDAFLRGAGAGAANSGIRYLSDSVGLKPGWLRPDMGSLMGMAGRLISPFGLLRDPKKGCGGISPFAPILGYGSARGYRYDLPKTGGAGQKKFSLMEFLKETAVGGITGGVASAGFYGAGKGIEKLKDSFRSGKGIRESRFPENPNDLFPENYAGLEEELKSDGRIIYKVKQGIKHIKLNIIPSMQVMGTMIVIIIMF